MNRTDGFTPVSLLTAAKNMLEKPDLYHAEVPSLLCLLYLFQVGAPATFSFSDLAGWLPESWPAGLGEDLRLALLNRWNEPTNGKIKEKLQSLIYIRYSTPPSATGQMSTASHELPKPPQTTSIPASQITTNTKPLESQTPGAQGTIPEMGPELTHAYKTLNRYLSASMHLVVSAQKTQLAQLKATFQACAFLALQDGNLDAYSHIEGLVHIWFTEQYEQHHYWVPSSESPDSRTRSSCWKARPAR